MRRIVPVRLWPLAALLIPGAVLAHTGHGSGLLYGFLHPFTGIDHLLAMLVVGWWSASALVGRWWLVPAAFTVATLVGALLAMNAGAQSSVVQIAILCSLLLLGTLLFTQQRLSIAMAAALVGVIGTMHGLAHGRELPSDAAASWWLSGMVLATLVLHFAGVLIARATRNRSAWARGGGAVAAGAGVLLMVTLALS